MMSALHGRLAWVLGLLGVGALAVQTAACAGPATPRITIRMLATGNNAGKIGTAVLVPMRGQTGATLTLAGVPSGTTVPVHLTTYLLEGSCQRQGAGRALAGAALASSLAQPGAMGASRGPVQLRYRIDEGFEQLRARPFALSVRQAPQDGGREIFCGDSPR